MFCLGVRTLDEFFLVIGTLFLVFCIPGLWMRFSFSLFGSFALLSNLAFLSGSVCNFLFTLEIQVFP